MKKLHLLLAFLLVSVLSFGQLTVTVPTVTAMPGQTVLVPVKLYGGTANPIGSANISIKYDTALLTYDTLANFTALMPASQWYYSGNYNADCNSFTVSANWLHPSLLTTSIPDGTTLFDMVFVYKGGNASLPFCVYEFTNAVFDFIPTTAVNGAVNVPSLTGPTTLCQGSAGNVYTTDAGNTNYVWTVTGGTVTSGGTSANNTVTVTWNTSGAGNVAVTYNTNISASLPVTVTPTYAVSVSIAASATSVCAGSTVTFTATPVNGGTVPVYQWKKNGANVGTNSATYAYVPVNNDVVTCELTSDYTCTTGNPATSNSITMSVTSNVSVSVSIAASQNPVTTGTSVTYTATPVNGGATPVYQWKLNGVNAGTNSPTFVYTPSNGDQIFCLVTSSVTCVNNPIATSNVITMTVTSPNALVVTLSNKVAMPGDVLYFPVKLKGASASGVPISSANIQITYDPAILDYDTLVNFYSAMPTGQWYFSGNNNMVSANWIEPSLLTLSVPDSTTLFEIRFTYLGGSQTLPFVVYEFTDAAFNFISTTPYNGSVEEFSTPELVGPVDVCEGSAANIYTTDAGKSNYLWNVNGGTITAGGSLSDNTVTVTWSTPGSHSIDVSYTNSYTTTLPVTVNALNAVNVSITASENPVCAGTSVTFTATPVNGGSNPVYQWKKNGSNVGTNSATYTYAPANNDVITCDLTSDIACASGNPATSNAITMSVTAKVNVSVSVTASQNPVAPGTTVTFTANPVNGGATPTFQWKVNGLNVGANSATYSYVPSNGDQIFCLLTSSLTCINNPIATSNVITMSVVSPNALIVTLPVKTALPGDVLHFPVKLKGAGSTGVPISSANIQITYDPAVLHYDTLVNFYAGTPGSQWYYSGNNNMVSANWIESALGTIAIPDSTTLFEIKFTYLGGNGTLPFVVYEFTDAVFEFIPTGHVDGGVNQLVPTNTTVQNVTAGSGNDTCFNALQTITVAGDGTTFTVQNGGSATFIAGQKISFMPGTTVQNGGYMHGYITLTNEYCGMLTPAIVSSQAGESTISALPEHMLNQTVRIFPNPTTGAFTIEVKGTNPSGITHVEIYTMSGIKTLSRKSEGVRTMEISAPQLTPGMYFIHIYTGSDKTVEKLIKL